MTASERHFEQIMHPSVRWKAMAVSYASSGVGSFLFLFFIAGPIVTVLNRCL